MFSNNLNDTVEGTNKTHNHEFICFGMSSEKEDECKTCKLKIPCTRWLLDEINN